MRRVILAWLVLTAPILTVLTTAGCEPEVKSVQKTERIEQSEPKMTSPGQEQIE
jgi:hypothetical protein